MISIKKTVFFKQGNYRIRVAVLEDYSDKARGEAEIKLVMKGQGTVSVLQT